MATPIWTGGAPTVAQVNTETPANPNTGDIYYVTLENHAGESHKVSFTVAATETVEAVCDGLKAAMVAAAAAGTAPWDEVTATEDNLKVTITADTAGVPFWVTTAIYDGSGGTAPTLTDASSTAVAGPSIYQDANNWDTGIIPANTDTVRIPKTATGTIYGVDDSSVLLTKFIKEPGCTVAIGSLAHPLYIDSDDLELAGTGVCYIQADNVGNDCLITQAGKTGTFPTSASLYLWGATIAEINVSVGADEYVALGPGNKAITATNIYHTSGNLTIGDNGTIATVKSSGGAFDCRSAITNLYAEGVGTARIHGNIATLLEARAGSTVKYLGIGTTTTVNIKESGVVDTSEDLRARTFTNTNIWAGGSLIDPFRTITHTNNIDLEQCGIDDVTLNLGVNFTLAISAI
jgi:hypothetical protein